MWRVSSRSGAVKVTQSLADFSQYASREIRRQKRHQNDLFCVD